MFPNDNDFESKFTFETEANPVADDLPFHALLLGNWSGNISQTEISKRKPLMIDRDNFEDLMKKLKVGLELDLHSGEENHLTIHFTELDDFHPDNLYRQLPIFSELRKLRSRLLNSDSFEEAAREVRSWFNETREEKPVITETQSSESPTTSGNLLDSILSQSVETGTITKTKNQNQTELGKLISQIVTPYLIKVDEKEQSKLLSAVDIATGELMRTILHHPKFQELEAAWRGLYFLVRRIETNQDLKFFICDISKEEILDNLKHVPNLADSYLYRWLFPEASETSEGGNWAIIAGNYSFGVNVDDVASLIRLAKLSAAADAPFITYIPPQAFGLQSTANSSTTESLKINESSVETKLWSTLREIPESEYVGILPLRLLARLPYGTATETVETFSFEEFTGEIQHQHYLWMNPVFAVLFLMSRSFQNFGWDFERNFYRDIEGLPTHVYKQNGETNTKPCAEMLLTENMAEFLSEQGLMPLISYRASDHVRLKRLQSITQPLSKLAGKWNR